MRLSIEVSDADLIAEFERFRAGSERDQFALQALRIGVLALRQARGAIDAEAVRREGERLLGDLQSQLQNHEKRLNDQLSGILKNYFDPNDGRFPERIDRLIRKDGELERTLKQHISGDESELVRTLMAHFGAESPLMKVLSPEQSNGLLATLREVVEAQLATQRQHILAQFSLNDRDSALSILLRELTDAQGKLSSDLATKVDDVIKEFSLDKKDSALNRLLENVETAQKTITREFSLDNEHSSLVRLRSTLTKLLDNQREQNQSFQDEVKQALAAMKARREEAQRSTRHGVEFEQLLAEQLQKEAQRLGDISEPSGHTTGVIRNCKIGDIVIELGPDTIAPGAKIVVEAKQKDKYTLADARKEIAEGRANRVAQVGLFVFSQRTAPEGLEPVARIGDDVFIRWDADDEHTDLYLRVGYSLARALCVRSARLAAGRDADFEVIDRALSEVLKQMEGLEDVEKWATTIKNNGEHIIRKVTTVRSKVEQQVDSLRDNVDAIKDTLTS
ncbi:MAG: hypothetical protein KDA90_01360 [Planctomycetaceae bacterium]|nr:hypothetical protein [Planctomycetaceae bacterium]